MYVNYISKKLGERLIVENMQVNHVTIRHSFRRALLKTSDHLVECRSITASPSLLQAPLFCTPIPLGCPEQRKVPELGTNY